MIVMRRYYLGCWGTWCYTTLAVLLLTGCTGRGGGGSGVTDGESTAVELALQAAADAIADHDYPKAMVQFTSALSEEPDCVEALLGRGKISIIAGVPKAALEDLSRAALLDPDNWEVLWFKARAYDALGEWSQAVKTYDALEAVVEDKPGLYINRGLAKEQLGDYHGAIGDFNKTIELDSTLALPQYYKANVLRAIERFPEAIAAYSHIPQDDPMYWRALMSRGVTHFRNGDKQLALKDLSKAVSIRPDEPDVYLSRAGVYHSTGEWERAIADCDCALNLKPSFSQALITRGNAYADLGEDALAISDYSKAIATDSRDYVALYNRGLFYVDKGQFDQAIPDLDRAIREAPEKPWCYFQRGRAYKGKSLYNEAASDFTRAIELEPEYAIAFVLRAECFEQLGETEKAKADRDRANTLGLEE